MELSARVAGPADLDAVAETIAVAFHDDPVWSFAFDDEPYRAAQFRRWWPMFVESALPHGWVWMGDAAETVAVWTPPGVPELTHEAEARSPALLDELLGARAPLVLQGLLQFEAAHRTTNRTTTSASSLRTTTTAARASASTCSRRTSS